MDRRRAEAINQLRILQSERERNKFNHEEVRQDMTKKLSVGKDIQHEVQYILEQIQKLTTEIEHLERNELEESRHKHDVALLIERLILERNDLQGKLEQLRFTYDNCVAEINREHAQMRAHNSHHTKLLVSKSLFTLLECML